MVRLRNGSTVLLSILSALALAACASAPETETTTPDAERTRALLAVLADPEAATRMGREGGREGARESDGAAGQLAAPQPDPSRAWGAPRRDPVVPGSSAPARRERGSGLVQPDAPEERLEPRAAEQERFTVSRPDSEIVASGRMTARPAGRSSRPSTDSVLAEGTNPIGTLPPQKLKQGTCGLFLWARKVDANLVFFGYGAQGGARMILNGEPVDLTRTAANGAALYGQYARQIYAHEGRTISLNLEFEQRSEVADGAIVRKGRLRFEDETGWAYVVPVGGLVACQRA